MKQKYLMVRDVTGESFNFRVEHFAIDLKNRHIRYVPITNDNSVSNIAGVVMIDNVVSFETYEREIDEDTTLHIPR